jgi:hypothetical protein
MSNDKNILSLLKKRNILTIGSKSFTATKKETSQVEAPKLKEVNPEKVKPRKVKTVKAQHAPSKLNKNHSFSQ